MFHHCRDCERAHGQCQLSSIVSWPIGSVRERDSNEMIPRSSPAWILPNAPIKVCGGIARAGTGRWKLGPSSVGFTLRSPFTLLLLLVSSHYIPLPLTPQPNCARSGQRSQHCSRCRRSVPDLGQHRQPPAHSDKRSPLLWSSPPAPLVCTTSPRRSEI